MIDTALILAGGASACGRSPTLPLIPVAGRSLLERSVDRLVAHGVTNIIVNVNHLGDLIAERLKGHARGPIAGHWRQRDERTTSLG
jgi:MurNAc alpha-1-phosphate uridylyltransferase